MAQNKSKSPLTVKNEIQRWIRELDIKPSEAAVLSAIKHYADTDGAASVGRTTLSNDTKYAPETVSRAITNLVKMGVLFVDYAVTKQGNLRYQKLQIRWQPDDVGSLGYVEVSDAGSSGQVTEAHQKYLTIDKSLHLDTELEPKMGASGACKVNPCISEKETGEEKQNQLVEEKDSDGNVTNYGAPSAQLIENYGKAAVRGSPKARVALWHQLGRVHFPNLPRFHPNHKLTNGQSQILHSIFDWWGEDTPEILAFGLRNWEPIDEHIRMHAVGWEPPTRPDPEHFLHRRDLIEEVWRKF